MANVFRFFCRHKVLMTVILLLVVFVGLVLIKPSFDYNMLNEADTMNVYHDGDLIATIENPSSIMGVVDAIYITSPKQLGLSPFRMKELYVLEYMSSDKTICRITVLSPSNDEAIATLEKKSKLNEWNRLNGECAVMRNRFCYFSLSKNYYTMLTKVWLISIVFSTKLQSCHLSPNTSPIRSPVPIKSVISGSQHLYCGDCVVNFMSITCCNYVSACFFSKV